ncbi:TonB-dependent receptor [Bacteroidales bacterium OttesenSCG-928-M06]|nr:TonB-dependent receptor [Bacteroidales bacterium OttesenSCG-928-M06]
MKKKKLGKSTAYRFRRFVRKAYAAYNSMHRIVNIGVLSGCMLTFVHTTQSGAQESVKTGLDSPLGEETELEEVVVSSTKVGLTLNQTAKLVTVITREEIAQQPVSSVQDLLKNVVGLDVRQRGSNGVLSGISMRGGTFEQTAILLNGANISNPQTAHYSLSLPINLSDIESIEIIQGPTSLYYGAGAFSGGVNIITKKDSDTGVYLKAEGGMHELFSGEFRGALKTKTSAHSISAGYDCSSGYMNNSDYKLLNALWQSNFNLDDSRLHIQFGLNDKAYGANTFFSAEYPNQYDETRSFFAAIKGETNTRLKLIPQLYWNRQYDQFHLFRPGTTNIPDWYKAPNNHRADVFGFNLNGQYKWKYGITNLGGEIRNEGIYSSVLGKLLPEPNGEYTYSDHRSNISYFVEHTYLYQGLTLGLGILANYNTAFGDDFGFYPNINVGYWFNNHYKIFASWNNSTRMPTFTDLYYKGKTHKGNSDVQPEESQSVELGVKYINHFMQTTLTGFYMQGKNLIDWVKENPEDLWESRNLTTLDKVGFEVNSSFLIKEIIPVLSDTRLNIGYTFLHQDKSIENLISNYVLDYLKHKVTIGLSHPIYKNITADWQFRWQDRQGTYTVYADPPYEADYPSFGILDVKVNWKLHDWNVYVSANNLFDTSYYDLGNIPQPGLWIMGGINYTIR